MIYVADSRTSYGRNNTSRLPDDDENGEIHAGGRLGVLGASAWHAAKLAISGSFGLCREITGS